MIDAGEELTIQEGGRTASLKLDNTYTVESAIKKLNDIAEKNGLEVTVENNGGSIGSLIINTVQNILFSSEVQLQGTEQRNR